MPWFLEVNIIVVMYVRIKVHSALSKSLLPDLDYALNPYVGCYHACAYCYARGYVGRYVDAGEHWGEVVYVKENLIDVLRIEVKRFRVGVVGISTITDPYQPIELKEELTRRSLNVLLSSGFRVSVQTKSDLVLRDLDILRRFKDRVDVGFTITSPNDSLMRPLEPRSPIPSRRAEALRRISSEGIETWIFYGPVIPYVNDGDDEVSEILKLAKETGSKVLIDKLHVKPWIVKSLGDALSRIVGKELALRILNRDFISSWWSSFKRRVLKKCLDYGVKCYPQLAEPPPKYSKSLLDYT